MVTKVSRVSWMVSGRSSGWLHRKRKPTTNISRNTPAPAPALSTASSPAVSPAVSAALSPALSAPAPAGRAVNLTHPRLAAETRKVAPSRASAQSAPTPAVRNPATTGPSRLPRAKVPISRPLAAVRSCARTRLGMAVTYATSNSVFSTAASAVSTYSSQICDPATHQTSGTAPSSTARTRSQTIMSLRRSTRSTTYPAKTPVPMAVAPETTVTRPIWTMDPVASRTSRGSASIETDPPSTDSAWPSQKTVKSRLRPSGGTES